MDKTSINSELQEKLETSLISGITNTIIAVFGILVISTATIPAILAYLCSWEWLALYPCTFAICTLLAGRKSINRLEVALWQVMPMALSSSIPKLTYQDLRLAAAICRLL